MPLPADPATHPGVEPFLISVDDDRAELRGQARDPKSLSARVGRTHAWERPTDARTQRGVRAVEPLAAGTVLGCLRASVMTLREWAATARGDAECAFSADYPLFNQRNGGTGLIACALGCGNLVALVNDGRGAGSAERPCNCALIEVLVRGCPALVLVTLAPISTGEELLRSYGDAFWARLQASSGATSAGGATAEPADLSPLVRRRSNSRGNAHGLAAVTTPDAAEAAGLGAAAETASCGGHAGASGSGPWGAAAVPVSVAPERPSSVVPAMSLVARLGRCTGDAAPTCLADTLRLQSTTKGDDPAATLQPLLAQCHRCAFMLALPPDASPQARTALAKFSAQLVAKGKAARCDEAVPGGRAVYLLPPGALASGMLALLGVPPLPEAIAASPHLLAFVLRAAVPALPLAVDAPPPQQPPLAAAPVPPPAAAAMAPPPPVPAAAQPLERPAVATAATAAPRAEPPPPLMRSPPAEPVDLLQLAVAYFSAPERAGRMLNVKEAAEAVYQQAKASGSPGLRPQMVQDMLKTHRAFSYSHGHVSLRGSAAVQAPAAAPPPPPTPRFPPELVELAVSYFTAPERVGRGQKKPDAIYAIYTMWLQRKSRAGEVRPQTVVVQNLINEHPAFRCAKGEVSLRAPRRGAEQLPGAALPPAPPAAAPAVLPAPALPHVAMPPAPPQPAACLQEALPPPRARETAPSDARFPPDVLELAMAYFTAPERVGRDHNKMEVIHTIWQQTHSLPGGRRPRAQVHSTIDEHPAFGKWLRYGYRAPSARADASAVFITLPQDASEAECR